MYKKLKPILLAMILPLLFIVVASFPVGFLEYRDRVLFSISIAIISVILGFVLSIINLKGRIKGRPFNPVNLISMLILALPAIYLVLYYHK
jgi:hypothetical protein